MDIIKEFNNMVNSGEFPVFEISLNNGECLIFKVNIVCGMFLSADCVNMEEFGSTSIDIDRDFNLQWHLEALYNCVVDEIILCGFEIAQ